MKNTERKHWLFSLCFGIDVAYQLPKTGGMYYPDAGNAINTKILKALGLEYIRFHDLSTLSPLWRCKAARTYALSRKCWVMPTKASPYAPTPIPSTPCKSKPPKPSAVLWRRTCRRAGSPLRNKKTREKSH